MHLKLFERLSREPWAITEVALQSMLDLYFAAKDRKAAGLPLDTQAIEAELGRPLDNTHAVTVRDGGVAVIPVNGPIFRYADLFTDVSGATTVEALTQDLHKAMVDPNIRSVVLNIDSPGGEVNGIHEFANRVADARERKPVIAYVSHLGASAAYWIASAASLVIIDATAAVGSIGVVAAVRDPSKSNARDIEFVSSQSPNKRADPTTEKGRAQIQKLVDETADVFIDAVARNRGVEREKVLADFGGGGLLVGKAAVDAGMADRLGSFEQIVAALALDARPTPIRPRMELPGPSRQRTPAPTARIPGGSPRGGRMPSKHFIRELLGLVAASDEQDDVLPPGTVEQTGGTPQPGQQIASAGIAPARSSTSTAQPQPGARERELEEQLAQARKQAADERASRITTEAEAFADQLIAGSRALPADRDRIVAFYRVAAEDDAAHPRATGTEAADQSRVALLKALYQDRPAHSLTQELVSASDAVLLLPNRASTPKPEDADVEQAQANARRWGERMNGNGRKPS